MAQFTNPQVGLITVYGEIADHYRLPLQAEAGWTEVQEPAHEEQPLLPAEGDELLEGEQKDSEEASSGEPPAGDPGAEPGTDTTTPAAVPGKRTR